MNFHATDDPADIFQRKHALRMEFIHPLECLPQTCPAPKDIGFNVLFFKQFDKNCGSFHYIWQERLWPPWCTVVWCAVVFLRQLRRQEKMVYEIRNIHLVWGVVVERRIRERPAICCQVIEALTSMLWAGKKLARVCPKTMLSEGTTWVIISFVN